MFRVFERFLADCRGNFAMMTAIAMVPIFMAAGLGLDLTTAYSAQTRLNSAADAAVLAALSKALNDAKVTGQKASYPAEELLAGSFMLANIENEYALDLTDFKVDIVNKGKYIEATASYNATVDTAIMKIFNRDEIVLANTVSGTTRVGDRVNFYFLVDNTPSMGVAATLSGITAMEKATAAAGVESCAFACHLTENAAVASNEADENGRNDENDDGRRDDDEDSGDCSDGGDDCDNAGAGTPRDNFEIARANGIDLRIDIVRNSTQGVMDFIHAKQFYPGQYKAAVYSFGSDAEKDFGLTEVAAPSSAFDDLKKQTADIQLMTIPYQGYDDDRQTDFDKTLNNLKQTVKKDEAGGDDAEKIIFVVTDGVADANKPNGCTKKKVNAGRCIEPMDIKACEQIKKQGYKLAVLYTTYLPIPNNGFYNKWVRPFQNEIPGALKACASEGLFAEVGFDDSIREAMEKLLNSAVETPRLIN